jgi:apolipoprotein N-acyltransferase
VVASALAFALYARVDWPWLAFGWVGLVPWLAVLDRVRSLRAALRAGLLMCVAFVLAVFAWFPSAIQNYTGAPWAAALLVVVVVAPLIEPQFIAFAVARYLAGQSARGSGRARTVFVGACVYVGTEWAWPKLFADTLGHGLYPSVRMRQAADLAGAHGLTFILIIANECALAVVQAFGSVSVEGLSSRIRQALAPAACVAALVLGLLAYGAIRCQQLHDESRTADRVTAGIVQADISQYDRMAAQFGTFEAVRRILDTHFALSHEALGRGSLDLLMWPETVYPTTFGSPKSAEGADFDREIGGLVVGTGVPLVFGSYDAEGGDEFNAAVFLEPTADGQVSFETYRKAELFPLTERVPAVMESGAVRHWLPWLGTWKPGRGPQVLTLILRNGHALRVAPLICYDAVDPRLAIAAVRRGAEVIVTLSNDSWFAYDGVPRLILMVTAFRSIETRRPQLRATNTGISAIITPTGEFLGTVGVHERATLVATVTPERYATTLMLAWGEWFGPTILVVGFMLLTAPLAGRARRRTPTTEEVQILQALSGG